ncbi:tetratricopeptide repeat protein [Nocardia arizonensis]|uniref:tetratricopeptide repeat protein n=1 Tax=Nocardia arizonensis TaxID=1141647 RepID=UPI0006CFFCC1|nr:tetratricopeptide repeat protein [Nocardia arizonensis]
MADSLDLDFVVAEYSEGLDLMVGIRSASRSESDRVVSQLAEAAAAGGPVARNVHAAALGLVGRLDEAAALWRTLIGEHPEFVDGWLNLASVQYRLGQVEQAIETLEACPIKTGTPGHMVLPRLSALRQRHATDLQDREMLVLRVAALRERLAIDRAEAGDLRALAISLARLRDVRNSGVGAAEVASAARLAYAADPDDVHMLELLARFLLVIGEVAACAVAVHELEIKAPHSALLERLRSVITSEQASEVAVQLEVLGDDGRVKEVRRWSHANPDIIGIRVEQWMNEMQDHLRAPDESAEAVALADRLVAVADDLYQVHLNGGIAYWLHGERDRALGHFHRAYLKAKNDEERQMIGSRVRRLVELFGGEGSGG